MKIIYLEEIKKSLEKIDLIIEDFGSSTEDVGREDTLSDFLCNTNDYS